MANSVEHAVNLRVSMDVVKVTGAEAIAKVIAAKVAEVTSQLEKYDINQARVDALAKTGTPLGSSGAGKEADAKDKNLRTKQLESISKGVGTVSTMGIGMLKTGFGILTDIFERIKQASPLLQAVESLFNLAMQLFFMPLGTKLATVLIPSIVELVDNVMQIWDGFEDKSLGEILGDTIELGAEIFGEYFQDIGEQLASEGGILGTIGELLQVMGEFIEGNGVKLIDTVIKITQFVIGNLPGILGTIVGLLILQKALMLVQIATTGSITPWSAGIAAAGVAAAIGAGVAAANYVSGYTAADGGYFPATPGGVPVLIAEGGEGETVVPDGKKVDFAKSVLGGNAGGTYNIYVNGYTDTDLENKIIRVLNEQTNLSRLRSGF